MNKRMTLVQMEPIARDATREALRGKNVPDGVWNQVMLGSGFEGDYGVFELYIPGEHPQDAKVIARTRVHRETGETIADTFL